MRLSFFIGILACGVAFGQAPTGKLEFEVATVKPAPPPADGRFFTGRRGGPGTADPGRVTYNFFSLKALLAGAYNVKTYQISGPPWLDSERYDISATIPEGTTKEQFNVMLQNLLLDRFGIKLHHETKDFPLYELSAAKNGPKLKASVADPSAPLDGAPPAPPKGPPPIGKDGFPEPPPGQKVSFIFLSPKGFHLVGRVQPVSGLTDLLGNVLDSPIVDKTGLTGTYDFTLDFSRESVGVGLPGLPPPPPPPGGAIGPGAAGGPGAGPAPTGDQSEAPGLFTAVQEQLGLKLDKKRGPVEVIVIDHAEKTPAEN